MSFDSIRIYEALLSQGIDRDKALAETKLQSLDNAYTKMDEKISKLDISVSDIKYNMVHMKYGIIFIAVIISLKFGTDLLPFIQMLITK